MTASTQHPLAEIYLQLMRDSRLWTAGLDSALRTVIMTVNTALGTQRTGLWSFGPDRQRLTLMLGYDAALQDFQHGAELQCSKFPDYFRQLELVQIDAVSDVGREPRLQEFIAQGVISTKLKAMLSCTVRVTSTSWGVLAVSDFARIREWSEWERWFVTSVANLIAHLITYAEVGRNEQWLRFVADNLPIGILKFDLEARCDYANPHWQQLTATQARDSLGEGWQQYVHPEDRAAMLDTVRMVGVSGERADAELRLLVRDKTIWVACSWVSERNVEGMPIALLGTFADVTHERTLRENERRYRALFDNSGDAIFLMQGERFIDCNARTLEMFACTREQIIGQPPYRFSPHMQPDGRLSQAVALEKISAALRGERQFFEWQHQRYDRTLFMAEVTLTCVTLNEEPHLLAAVRDISKRKAVEDALRRSNERLHRINSIAARLYGLRDVESVARAIVEILSEHRSAPLVTFFTYDAANNIGTLLAQCDGRGSVVNLPQHAMQWSPQARGEEDVGILSDMESLPTSSIMRAALRERGTCSIVYIWLRGEVERIGLIVLEYRDVVILDDDQREDFTAIGKTISIALSNVLFIARLERKAASDMNDAGAF